MHGQRQLQLLSLATALAVLAGAERASATRVCAPPAGGGAVVHTRAETELELHPGPGFFVVTGAAATADATCVSQKIANSVLADLVERIDAELGIDPQIAVLLSAAPLACGNLFYVPVANDVRGIGYEHDDPREVFDDSPTSRLEGIAFLNDFPYWRLHPGEFQRDFSHEIGHRWGARVHAQDIDGALLGRDAQHWSYFLDSAGSPLEGNSWTMNDSGDYVAETPLAPAVFSELDLYLMGSLEPALVSPRALLTPTTKGTDCLGHPIAASSPPQSCGALTFEGSVENVTLDAVIQAEGARDPAPDPTPRTLDIAVFVLSNGADFPDDECEALAAALPERVADFATASRGAVSLAPFSDPNGSCELARQEPAPPATAPNGASGCEFAGAAHHGGFGWCGAFVTLLWLRRSVRLRRRDGDR